MSDTGLPTPPEGVLDDDHLFAAWTATVAGELLTEVRAQGLEGKELKDAGDRAAHELLMKLFATYRPDDAVLSDYSAAERKVLPFQIDRAADAIECLVTEGLEKTQSRFNS